MESYADTRKDENEKLFVEERRNRIVEFLNFHKKTSVAELALLFRVGEPTIRRDLKELEARGVIQRTHGGALSIYSTYEEYP